LEANNNGLVDRHRSRGMGWKFGLRLRKRWAKPWWARSGDSSHSLFSSTKA